ncbi:MAG TPA: zf-HC2 domain-containing protein [Polyangia bacterium]|nr:zf-HC2 domain-containing protein [Polyangia bacterium]
MTTKCERFEVEIGMRQHGALDARETARLDGHLTTCASCRDFAAAGGDFDLALERQVATELETVEWRAVEDGVTRLQRSYRRKLWLAPLFVLQVPLIFWLGLGQAPPRELLLAAPLTPLLFAAYVWLVNRPFRALMSAVLRGDDLVAGFVAELRRQRLRARIFVGVNALLTLTCLTQALIVPELRLKLFELAGGLFFAAWATYDLAFKLPCLSRALDEAVQ